MEKRGIKLFFLIGIIFLLILNLISSLGVSPGKVELNFEPGLKTNIFYSVREGNPDKELEISVGGPLADYITLSTDKMTGSGKFYLTLELPQKMEKPGKNVEYVVVREKVDDELVGGTVGTSVTIGAAIVVHVPYPGRFLDVDLQSHDVNVNEPVTLNLEIKSQGTENLSIAPKIEISSNEKVHDTLQLNNRVIYSQEKLELKKTLDTTGYNPGTYNATALVDYGEIATDIAEFRIGELIINMLNYSEKIKIGGIKAFEIEIESGWNDKIDGAYAEVSIFNDTSELVNFKTDTTELTPWEIKKITGHFNSDNFKEGIYDANITLYYFGGQQGKSNSETAKVEFVEGVDVILIGGIILGIIILALLIYFGRKYVHFGKKRK